LFYLKSWALVNEWEQLFLVKLVDALLSQLKLPWQQEESYPE
jgi:hypothetical protein